MPLYAYRALDKTGHIVKSRIEDESKNAVVRKIKRNELTPISVVKLKTRTQKNKKNIKNVDAMLKTLNNGKVLKKKESQKQVSLSDKLKNQLSITNKITKKDIIVFTQKFYLLKKANFNNIHALSTIVESTENPKLKDIIEDLVAGLEAGENMYSTMEYYPEVFPYIYINMIKVGELSRFINRLIATSSKISRRSKCLQ